MEPCNRCKKDVITFKQEYTTMPQTEKNEIRRIKETFCAYCGNCLHHEEIDEIPEASK